MLLKSQKDVLNIKKTGEYMLVSDIDMENIVVESRLLDDFRGAIDGCGYAIRNITVHCNVDYDEQSIALFNTIFKATIKNITFENVVFKVKDNGCSPHIASFCVTCENSELENVVVEHKFSEPLPMVLESNSSKYVNCRSLSSTIPTNVVAFSYKDTIT